MSHIAEGLLHAHLDGALEPADRERWAEAEAHLAVCEDCRRRLEAARELRDAASVLLAAAAVPPAERPSFDTLVAEAGRRRSDASDTAAGSVGVGTEVPRAREARYPPPRRWWGSPTKLAWAASLVLAVGAGWIGRQLVVEEGGDVPLVMESRVAPESPGSAESIPPREAGALEDDARGADGAALGRAERLEGEARMEEEDAGFRARAPEQENEADRRADEAREEAPAKAADEGAPIALAPQTLARRGPGGPCYGLESDQSPGGVLRLRPDGTAALLGDGRPLVGFWERPSTDSVTARLTDGEAWIELRLGSDDLERSARDCPAG